MSGILDHLSIGFGVAFSLTNLLVAAIGSFFGTLVGVLPGLGPINGVAMLIPIAFAMNLPPETALILLAAVYVGAEYGGRITSILLSVPGEASAIMTTLDGYPLARQGSQRGAVAVGLVGVLRRHRVGGGHHPARAAAGQMGAGLRSG